MNTNVLNDVIKAVNELKGEHEIVNTDEGTVHKVYTNVSLDSLTWMLYAVAWDLSFGYHFMRFTINDTKYIIYS